MRNVFRGLIMVSLFLMIFTTQPASAATRFQLELGGTVSGGVSLNWDNPVDYDSSLESGNFCIQRKVKGSSWETLAEMEGRDWREEFEYVDDTTTYGKSYVYRIKATNFTYDYDKPAEDMYSNSESISYKNIKTPEIDSIVSSANYVEVKWTRIKNASGYQVYTYNKSTGKYSLAATLKDGSKTKWKDKTTPGLKSKTYAVRSYGYTNETRFVSGYSDCKSTRTKNFKCKLSLAKTKAGNVTLTWKDPYAYEEDYNDYYNETKSFAIYRRTSANKTWKKIGTRKANYLDSQYTYVDKNVPYGVTVYYKIAGFGTTEDWDADIEYSWQGTSLDKSIKAAKVKTPKIKVSSTTASTSLKVSWNKINGAAGYKIYAYNAKRGKYTLVKTIKSGKTTSWTHKNLKTGSKKTYKVKSYGKRKGKTYNSDFSNKVSKTVTKNQKNWSPSTSFNNYGGPILRDKSISYSNGKLKYKALVLNDRIFYADQFNWIRISVYADGKLIGQQKFYDKSINLDGYDMKYMTFTLNKGTKKVVNLRTADLDIDWQYNYQFVY